MSDGGSAQITNCEEIFSNFPCPHIFWALSDRGSRGLEAEGASAPLGRQKTRVTQWGINIAGVNPCCRAGEQRLQYEQLSKNENAAAPLDADAPRGEAELRDRQPEPKHGVYQQIGSRRPPMDSSPVSSWYAASRRDGRGRGSNLSPVRRPARWTSPPAPARRCRAAAEHRSWPGCRGGAKTCRRRRGCHAARS
jgi:hypothetical protein